MQSYHFIALDLHVMLNVMCDLQVFAQTIRRSNCNGRHTRKVVEMQGLALLNFYESRKQVCLSTKRIVIEDPLALIYTMQQFTKAYS